MYFIVSEEKIIFQKINQKDEDTYIFITTLIMLHDMHTYTYIYSCFGKK